MIFFFTNNVMISYGDAAGSATHSKLRTDHTTHGAAPSKEYVLQFPGRATGQYHYSIVVLG